MDRYLKTLDNLGEYFFISLMLGVAATLFLQSWRKNLSYLLAAVAFGTILGYGVFNVPQFTDFAVLATLFGTITGPATIAIIQKKTVIDLANDLREVADRAVRRHPSSTNLPEPSRDARRLPTQGDPYDKSN